MKPKYSVIVPLYNKAQYVRNALESILAQTYKDFECIVVDDGSTDGSLDVVRSLDIGDCKLEIISQANAGVAAARNNGVAKSKGEYVCFLDADDWWEAEFLEEMDRMIREYPDAGLYATNYVYYKPGKTHVVFNIPRGYINYPEVYTKTGAMPITSNTVCLPRHVFVELGGFPNGIKLGEDFLLWAKATLHYKVAFCEIPLAYYNNDVPTHLRATRNLHKPKYHMLFNLGEIESIVDSKLSIDDREEWKSLLDKLRVSELIEYWLNDEYHDMAAKELKKVDWNKQNRKARVLYKRPICLLKAHHRIMQIGSYCKQKLIKLIK